MTNVITDMSTHQRTGAVSAYFANSQRFQRIFSVLSAKISVKIFKNLTKKWEKTTDFDVQVYSFALKDS